MSNDAFLVIDWNALATDVTENFQETGQWFVTQGFLPQITAHSGDVIDWNALAADVVENYQETGQWFVTEGFLPFFRVDPFA